MQPGDYMPSKIEQRDKPKSIWARVWIVVGGLGTVAAALGIIAQVSGGWSWLRTRWDTLNAIELTGSYDGEVWFSAKPEQFSWLRDEWCYPSLRGFRSRFKVEREKLFRQNEGGLPRPFKTNWVEASVFISNRKVLRIRYSNSDWPSDFIDYNPKKTAEFKENQRFPQDDGKVTSGKKRLVLSCSRCQLSQDGISYDCKE